MYLRTQFRMQFAILHSHNAQIVQKVHEPEITGERERHTRIKNTYVHTRVYAPGNFSISLCVYEIFIIPFKGKRVESLLQYTLLRCYNKEEKQNK